jgi:hypothetical protein
VTEDSLPTSASKLQNGKDQVCLRIISFRRATSNNVEQKILYIDPPFECSSPKPCAGLRTVSGAYLQNLDLSKTIRHPLWCASSGHISAYMSHVSERINSLSN